MKNTLFTLAIMALSSPVFSQENVRIDRLQQEITTLNERIDSLKNEIQNEILDNGYFLIVKSRYTYSNPNIEMKDTEYGATIDTIASGDGIKIIDKTIINFKVLYKGKIGYINARDIDMTRHPALDYLESSYSRQTKSDYSAKSNDGGSVGVSTRSTGSSNGGSVSVKGYYRKDGTYVKPHTRSTPKRSGGRRR
jgi:hypothetical protein